MSKTWNGKKKRIRGEVQRIAEHLDSSIVTSKKPHPEVWQGIVDYLESAIWAGVSIQREHSAITDDTTLGGMFKKLNALLPKGFTISSITFREEDA